MGDIDILTKESEPEVAVPKLDDKDKELSADEMSKSKFKELEPERVSWSDGEAVYSF